MSLIGWQIFEAEIRQEVYRFLFFGIWLRVTQVARLRRIRACGFRISSGNAIRPGRIRDARALFRLRCHSYLDSTVIPKRELFEIISPAPSGSKKSKPQPRLRAQGRAVRDLIGMAAS